MPAKKNLDAPNPKDGVNQKYKRKVWQTVYKLRGNIDAPGYWNVFQHFISCSHLFFQKSPLEPPPQVIDSVRPGIEFPDSQESPVY
jgi:hypothetical protein